MEWRFRSPNITEAHCRACIIQGGTEVPNRQWARHYSEIFERKVEVGDLLEEPPCQSPGVLEDIQEKHGRPCPRIELEPGDELIAELIGPALSEHTRPFGPELFRLRTRGLPARERLAELRTLLAVMGSKQVVDQLYPDPKKAKAGRK